MSVWNDLCHNSEDWPALVNAVMNVRFASHAGNSVSVQLVSTCIESL